MNKVRGSRVFLFLQIFILIIQAVIFYVTEKSSSISFFVVNFSSLSVVFCFLISWIVRNKTHVKGKGFSIILFFSLMSWVVSFQVPLEVVYGNTQLLNTSLNLIYDIGVLNQQVAFASMMLNFFLFGVTCSYLFRNKNIVPNSNSLVKQYVPEKPLYFLTLISFFIFIITLNADYLSSGHGVVKIDSISSVFLGFFVKFSVLYLAIRIYNLNMKRKSAVDVLNDIGWLYIALVFFAAVLFFIAHNRFYPIMILSPFIFSFFLIYSKRINVLYVIGFFITLSILATLFKIYGVDAIFSRGLSIHENYTISKFYFPFTAELAGSIYSGNILYSLWENSDFSLYGASYIVGVMRGFPGVVGLINPSPHLYDSAIVATIFSGLNYGVGTTSIFDLLVNFGPLLSLALFGMTGFLFGRSELKIYAINPTIYAYVIYLTITVLLFFYPRASLNDLVGLIIFNLLFVKFYLALLKLRKK